MAPVFVTITSKLPEFQGMPKIDKYPIEPDQTWLSLFQLPFHSRIPFDPSVHGLKSSKGTSIALAEHLIRNTSVLFTRNSISVQIVNKPRRVRSKIVTVGGGNQGGIGIGRGIRIRPVPVVLKGKGGLRTPSPSKGQGQRPRVLPPPETLIPPPPVPVQAQAPPPQGNQTPEVKNVNVNGIPPRGRIRFPNFDDPASANDTATATPTARSQPQPQANDFDDDDNESMASQDDQAEAADSIGVANPGFSDLKKRILAQISRIPNQDFEKMKIELVAMRNDRYRWSRKAPMASSMIFQAFGQ
jgi:hypothetical protein